MNHERAGRVVVLAAAGACLVLIAVAVALALTHPPTAEEFAGADLGFAVAFGGLAVAGAVTALAAPGNRLALALALGALAFTLPVAAGEYAVHALPGGRDWPLGTTAAWLSAWPPPLAYAVLAVAVPVLFPTGGPSRLWRRLGPVVAAASLLAALALMVRPGRLDGLVEVENPYGVKGLGTVAETVASVAPVVVAGSALVALLDLAVRGSRSRGDERLQFQVVGLGVGLLVLSLLVRGVLAGGDAAPWLVQALGLVGFLAVPASLAVAMARFRLYDVGRLVDRALLYALVSAGVVALYVTAVALLGGALGSRVDLAASVLAAGVAAVLYPLLREGVQQLVARRLYGWRDDPYVVVSSLAARLEGRATDDVVADAVTGLRSSLRLPWLAVIDASGRTRASSGERPESVGTVELRAQGVVVGSLEVAPRKRERDLGARDLEVLGDAAAQLATALHAADLTRDLQASRERLVRAREEERRRLRRDLHDGLGPVLTGVVLGLDGVTALVPRDPDAAVQLAAKVGQDARAAVDEVRRVVHDLRPSALDQLGLVSALEQRAAALSTDELEIRVSAPRLPALPAAVEVACYAVAVEAMTNVVRHARASRCEVRIALNGRLLLEVRDDGHGEHGPPGVGTQSSQERAAELAGEVTVTAAPGQGTVLRLALPLEQAPC